MGTPTWRTWTEHASTRKVYVDATLGSDSYDGLSGTVDGGGVGPKQTVAAGLALIRDGYPDWLLFKCGEVWTDEILGLYDSHSGLDADNPIVFTSYGSGARPRFDVGTVTFCESSSSNCLFDDLEVYCYARDPSHGSFAGWPIANSGSPSGFKMAGGLTHNVTIQNCKVSFFDTNINFLKNQSTARGAEDCFILGNVCHNAWADTTVGQHAQGIYCENLVRGTVKYNFADHNGWHPDGDGAGGEAEPAGLNHGLYFPDAYDTVIEANISCRNDLFGIKCASAYGIYTPDARWERTVVRNNLVFDQPSAISIGGHSYNAYCYLSCDFTHNVAIHCGGRGGSTAWTTPADAPSRPWQRAFLSVQGADGVLMDRNLAIHGNTDNTAWDTRGLLEVGKGDQLPTLLRDLTVTNNIGYGLLAGTNHGLINPAPNEWGIETGLASEPGVYTVSGTVTASGNEYGQSAGSYTDPARDLLSYMTSIGQTGVDDAATKALLYTLIRAQRRTSWNADITADAINSYLRAGFDMTNPDGSSGSMKSYVFAAGGVVVAVTTGGA